jgi:hypothetical protein
MAELSRQKRKSEYVTFVTNIKKTAGTFAALAAALLFGSEHR